MKQLLQTYGKHVALALDERAFVGSLDSERVLELLEPPECNDRRQVQAVALHAADDNKLYCAVARFNKTLCVYEIDLSVEVASEGLSPISTHQTNKRASSLCFATVPGPQSPLTLVIAADLTGDATAFPLRIITDDTEADKELDSNRNRRLLLGHTASMLTGARVVEDGSVGRILTSDRDEKVRISEFPNTHVIQGFLLGHEAFVSSMAVAENDGVTRCATSSGDGSVRLWDYVKLEQIAMEQSEEGVVPSRVAISPNGNVLAVIYNESRQLRLLQASGDKLNLLCSIESGSDALSLEFVNDSTLLVLTTGPSYVACYQVADQDSGHQLKSCEQVFCNAIRALAAKESIEMPTSVLEKDDYGNFKMQKLGESRGQATKMPWNNVARREIAKGRMKRSRERKRKRGEQTTDEGIIKSD